MNRRDFMLQLSASITAPALATPASAEPAPQAQPTALSSLYILPTLAHWCRLDTPKLPLDGINMDPVLREHPPAPARSIIYISYPGGPGMVHAIRSGPWKLRVAQNDGEIYTNDHTTVHVGFDFCDTTHCQFLREIPPPDSPPTITTHTPTDYTSPSKTALLPPAPRAVATPALNHPPHRA